MDKKKILIVDDEKDWVQMLAMKLKSEGYQTEAAFDGIQAMMQVVKLEPDLILLDIKMPAGGGLETLKHIRASVKTFSSPVIVITGRGDEEIKEAAEKLGISGYFVKPMDMAQLMNRIKTVLSQ